MPSKSSRAVWAIAALGWLLAACLGAMWMSAESSAVDVAIVRLDERISGAEQPAVQFETGLSKARSTLAFVSNGTIDRLIAEGAFVEAYREPVGSHPNWLGKNADVQWGPVTAYEDAGGKVWIYYTDLGWLWSPE